MKDTARLDIASYDLNYFSRIIAVRANIYNYIRVTTGEKCLDYTLF